MKNILIPTDFSDNAWNATQYAIKLFRNEVCVFHLLNIYTPTIAYGRYTSPMVDGVLIEDMLSLNSENGLNHILRRIHKTYNYSNHSFKTISSLNLLSNEIEYRVQKENIDLIVMGTKGASGIEEVFMGSNTVRVIKSTKNCPVLAIPHNYTFEKPSEIAFATDFYRFYTISELRPLINLAKAFKAKVRVVHVQYAIKSLTETQQFNLNMLLKYLDEVEHYVHTVSELNSVSQTLETFTEQMNIHLLAMLNYEHSYLEKMTHEPVVKRVAFHTQVPLLVIPELGMDNASKFMDSNGEVHSN